MQAQSTLSGGTEGSINPTTANQSVGRAGERALTKGPPTWQTEEVKPSVDINEEQTG